MENLAICPKCAQKTFDLKTGMCECGFTVEELEKIVASVFFAFASLSSVIKEEFTSMLAKFYKMMSPILDAIEGEET